MLSYEESLKILKNTNALIEGHFILSSGLHSPQYVQCAKLLSKPAEGLKICESLALKIKNKISKFDLVLSPALGGVIVGYEIGKLVGKETIFSERIDGKFVLRRGFEIKKKSKVLIVEDVITTGKSSLECFDLVKYYGGDVVGYACIIDRTMGNSKISKEIISQLNLNIPTYEKDKLPKDLLNIKPIKPGSRNI